MRNPYLVELEKHFAMSRRHVFLDRQKLTEFAAGIALQELPSPSWHEPIFPEDDVECVEFFGWENTINFYFTDVRTKEKFKTLWPECRHCRQRIELYQHVDKHTLRCIPHDAEAKVWTGAFAMGACFARAVRDNGIQLFQAELYRGKEWIPDLARFVFRGVSPLTVIPMLEDRFRLLRMSANSLRDFGDSWTNLFRRASYRAFRAPYESDSPEPGVVQMLAETFPSYADSYLFNDNGLIRYLPFYKRAHLFVQMYEARARSSKVLPRIKDAECLILPADYQLPRAFRAVGGFHYSPRLLGKINAQEEIPEGSRMEIEIRLSTVEAGEIIEQEVNRIRKVRGLTPYTKVELDYLLWTKGKSLEEPHHLTPTTNY